jgi:hypothetical protein
MYVQRPCLYSATNSNIWHALYVNQLCTPAVDAFDTTYNTGDTEYEGCHICISKADILLECKNVLFTF